MSQRVQTFTEGDWVVHHRYGIGKVKGTEMKHLGGPRTPYYKIETHDSTVWIPVDKLTSEWFRPLASPNELEKALEVLKRPARAMHANFRKRHERIEQVKLENRLIAIARLVRDLWARQRIKHLTNTEENALRSFTRRFLAEWSLALGCDIDEARQEMYALLQQNRPDG